MRKRLKFKQNKYELMMVLRPIDEAMVKETIAKVVDRINEEGEVTSTDEWGKKTLAYEVDGETEGIYILVYFTSNFKAVNKLDQYIRMESNILRNVIVIKG